MTTSAQQWRKAREQGVEVKLPISGYVVALRPIEIDFFLAHGHVPNMLQDVVNDLLNLGTAQNAVPATDTLEKQKEWLSFLNELCKFAFVAPQVKDNPNDDELSVDDISYYDKVWLYRMFFGRPAQFLRTFLEQQSERVAAVGNPENSGRAPQSALAHSVVGQPPDGHARHVDGNVR